MTTNEVIDNLENKPFNSSTVSSSKKLTTAEQITLETRWTAHLQRLVDFGNKRWLRNFSLRLEMDVNDSSGENQ